MPYSLTNTPVTPTRTPDSGTWTAFTIKPRFEKQHQMTNVHPMFLETLILRNVSASFECNECTYIAKTSRLKRRKSANSHPTLVNQVRSQSTLVKSKTRSHAGKDTEDTWGLARAFCE